MSDELQLWVAALIVYTGLIVSVLGTIFGSPVMMIFVLVFTFMAVIVTFEIRNQL